VPHLGAPMTMKRGLHGAPDGQTGEADAAARAPDGQGGAIGWSRYQYGTCARHMYPLLHIFNCTHTSNLRTL